MNHRENAGFFSRAGHGGASVLFALILAVGSATHVSALPFETPGQPDDGDKQLAPEPDGRHDSVVPPESGDRPSFRRQDEGSAPAEEDGREYEEPEYLEGDGLEGTSFEESPDHARRKARLDIRRDCVPL